MANLIKPAPFVDILAFCIDDSLPKFKPDNWVKKNKLYRLKYMAESLNTNEMAITIMDRNGDEINPSDSIKAFKSERFILFQIFLN
jgi:hypothetical protein